ncbi:hypothetical protein HK102_009226 [Quaeritorhiza haematococci]|nr:hypothetical protein HK102_009226 [Quaeritorhiza haematococci]
MGPQARFDLVNFKTEATKRNRTFTTVEFLKKIVETNPEDVTSETLTTIFESEGIPPTDPTDKKHLTETLVGSESLSAPIISTASDTLRPISSHLTEVCDRYPSYNFDPNDGSVVSIVKTSVEYRSQTQPQPQEGTEPKKANVVEGGAVTTTTTTTTTGGKQGKVFGTPVTTIFRKKTKSTGEGVVSDTEETEEPVEEPTEKDKKTRRMSGILSGVSGVFRRKTTKDESVTEGDDGKTAESTTVTKTVVVGEPEEDGKTVKKTIVTKKASIIVGGSETMKTIASDETLVVEEPEVDVYGAIKTFKDGIAKLSPSAKFDLWSFISKCKDVNPTFNIREFLEKLVEKEKDLSEETIVQVFKDCGLPDTTPETSRTLIKVLFTDEAVTDEGINRLVVTVKKTGVVDFLATVFRVPSPTPSIHSPKDQTSSIIDLGPPKQGVEVATLGSTRNFLSKVLAIDKSAKFDAPQFVNECKKSNPNFTIVSFLDGLNTLTEDEVTDERVQQVLKDCGVPTDEQQYTQLMTTLCGKPEWSTRIIKELLTMIKPVGVDAFVDNTESFSFIDTERDSADSLAAEAFVTKIGTFSPRVLFALKYFIAQCKNIQSEFDFVTFMEKLKEGVPPNGDAPSTDEQLRAVFKDAGLDVSDKTYKYLLVVLCGDYDFRFKIFGEWFQILREKGSEWFKAHIPVALQSRQSADQAGRGFLQQVFSLSNSVKFNYRSFVRVTRIINDGFDVRLFCNKLASQKPPLTDEVLMVLFKDAGVVWTMEQYQNVLTELCGDYEWRLQVVEIWRDYLVEYGSSSFLKYIFIWLEERAAAEFALQQFFLKLRSYGTKVKFDLDAFITRCRSIHPHFEIRIFLEMLADTSKETAITPKSLVDAFKASGLSDITEEDSRALVQVLFDDYDIGLEILYDMAKASKLGLSGTEQLLEYYYSWIDVVRGFYSRVRAIGPHVRFDFRAFVDKCKKTNPGFDVRVFIEKFVTVSDAITVDTVKQTFKETGLNLDDAEYEALVVTLCGEYNAHLKVFSEWLATLRRCEVDTFVRISSSDISMEEGALTRMEETAAIKTFLVKLRAVGASFNLNSFIDGCKTIKSDFDIARFIRKLLTVKGTLDIPSMVTVFHESGLSIPEEECSRLLKAFCGPRWNRVLSWWVLLIRMIGIDTFLKEYETIVKSGDNEVKSEGQEVAAAIKVFLARIRSTGGNSQFKLWSFFNQCKTLNPDFDWKQFLEVLRKTSKKGVSNADFVTNVLEGSGLTISKEHQRSLMSTLFGEPSIAAEAFAEWSYCLRLCGVEPFTAEVEPFLDDKAPREVAKAATSVAQKAEEPATGGGSGWFSRMVKAAGDVGGAVVNTAVNTAASAVDAVQDTIWDDEDEKETTE